MSSLEVMSDPLKEQLGAGQPCIELSPWLLHLVFDAAVFVFRAKKSILNPMLTKEGNYRKILREI